MSDLLSALLQSVGDAVFVLDTGDRVRSANPAGARLVGRACRDLLGVHFHDVVHGCGSGGAGPREECPLARARRLGAPVRADEDTILRADGATVPVALTATPLGEAGRDGWLVVASDRSADTALREWTRRDENARSRLARIRAALEEDRFVLHAQPVVDLATGRVVQHELLLRMATPDGTLALPGDFLPTAEEHGLIRAIDGWVIRRAASLAGAGHPVQVNLSAASLADAGLAGAVEDALLVAGADPRDVVLEVTETAVIRNEAAASAFLARMRELGCRVALDDFGTGYGGFRHIKQLPVDILKLDVEFVRDLPASRASRHVVEAVVSLARAFGHRTIAEGVENEETFAMLATLGVDFAQGHHLGRPRPLREAFEPLRI
ncbi:MAG TPA: EAL domain-containing protein [Miltoncostaea sp.]|jgi:PAS domain S-box-containing protein|nr:EAL domain-containing protein [Miltoncostaea sp.]